jgi:uncharacterized protein YqjF (DUF2071 family)
VARRIRPASHAPLAGPLEHFLTERYLLYAQWRDGALRRGQVHHTPYPLQHAELSDWDESLLATAHVPRVRRPARAAASRATTAIAGAAAPLCFHVASVTFMLSG